VVHANEKVAKYLGIPVGTEVIDIQRLRFINDEPIQLVTTYIPFQVFPPLAKVDLTNRSLYEYLEKEGGIFLTRGRRYIESVLANETESSLLSIERGAPLLMLESVSYSESGQPIEFYHALHRGDRTRFEVELVRMRDQRNLTPESSSPFTTTREK
jgi:GntR family transcriptional regulator